MPPPTIAPFGGRDERVQHCAGIVAHYDGPTDLFGVPVSVGLYVMPSRRDHVPQG